MGYHRAGFNVVGIDIAPQPNYPFESFVGDALRVLEDHSYLARFDAIHASPPCQAYSTLNRFNETSYPDLYVPVRDRIEATGLPWAIENVVGAPYRSGVILCGSMFGLAVRRHRNFETRDLIFPPQCDHATQGRPVGVYGHGQFYWEDGEKQWRNVPRAEAEAAMGIDWMSRAELSEAIPPAFTEYVGAALLANREIGAVGG